MRLLRQLRVFLFFFKKRFSAEKKNTKRKKNYFSPLEVFVRKKIAAFVVFYSLVFVLLVSFYLWGVFCAQKIFLKKKNRLEVVLITSFTILLMFCLSFYQWLSYLCYPYNLIILSNCWNHIILLSFNYIN